MMYFIYEELIGFRMKNPTFMKLEVGLINVKYN